MARPISSPGNVHYNGFDFPAPLSMKVRISPNYDQAEATVRHRTYQVSIETILAAEDFLTTAYGGPALVAGQEIDTAMTVLRKRLTEPGKTLKIKNQGLGADLTIDYSNVVARGPKPRVLVFEPIGSNLSARVVWECEFTVIECATGIITSPSPLGEFVYGIEFGITQDGMTTTTFSGRIEVNVKRKGEGITEYYRMIDKTADFERQRIAFGQAVNTQRTQNYRLSEDKRFLYFTISDTEIASDNPFFPGCLNMDIRQRIAPGSHGAIANVYQKTISGSIEVAATYPKKLAWAAFVWVLTHVDEWPTITSGAKGGGGTPESYSKTPPEKEKNPILLLDFNMEEEIFGRRMQFSVTWSFKFDRPHDLLTHCGFWQPVGTPGNWAYWKQSMSAPNRPHSVRGVANRGVIASQERVVDFCLGLATPVGPSSKLPRKPLLTYAQKIFGPPGRDGGWLQYDVKVHILTLDAGSVVSRRVGSSPGSRGSMIEYLPGATTGKVTGTKAGTSDHYLEIQQRANPIYRLVLVGTARRVAYPIETKDLALMDTIDGEKADQLLISLDHGANELARQPSLYRIYKRRWSAIYQVPSPKADFKLKNHP